MMERAGARYVFNKIHYVPSAYHIYKAEPGFDYMLKPCPFCGSKDAQIVEYDVEFLHDTCPEFTKEPRHRKAFSVKCPLCRAEISGICEWEVEDAVIAWNGRVENGINPWGKKVE